MLPIPQIRIHQQYALIGMDSVPAKLEIQQPQAQMEIYRTPAKLDIQCPRGELNIDSGPAWDALGLGSNFLFMSRIYSQAKQIALQGTARIVEDGNRLADLTNKNDPIPEFAARAFDPVDFEYRTEASIDNIQITYLPHQPIINNQPGQMDIQVQNHPPVIQYDPGKLNVYMLQKNSIEITPPIIDLQI